MESGDMKEGGKSDIAGMAKTLAAAFQDDPSFEWIIPDATSRLKQLISFFQFIVEEDMTAGRALMSDGAKAVSLWRAPQLLKVLPLGVIRSNIAFLRILGFSLLNGARVANAMATHHPNFPHWYLRYLSVAPEVQGKGWGGIAMRAGIERAEADGLPIFLETAKLSNVGLYRRFGFDLIDEWDVPGGGPHFWSMLRD